MAKKKAVLASEFHAAGLWPADELPFVREILAQPFDDAPRLVFADWLEERGDPRAEFIRVQCQLAKLRIRDPQYAALEARNLALLERHRVNWLAPYPKLPGMAWGIDCSQWDWGARETRYYFRRGLVSAVRCQTFSTFRNLLPKLVDAGVTELELDLTLENAGIIGKSPEAGRLEALLLSNMQAISCAFLLRSPLLGPVWRLDLNYSSDAQAPLKVFLEREQSKSLRWLSLKRAPPASMGPLLDWKHLRELDVFDARADASGLVEALADSALRPSYVPLEGNVMPNTFVAWCERLATAPAMSEVVRMSLLRTGPPQALEGLKLPPKVAALEVAGGFGDAGAAALAQAPAAEQLQELRLRCYNLRDAGAELLASGRWRQLRSLSVSSMNLTWQGAETLVKAFARLDRLELTGFKLARGQKAALRDMFAGGELII